MTNSLKILVIGITGQVGKEVFTSLQRLNKQANKFYQLFGTQRQTSTNTPENIFALNLMDPNDIKIILEQIKPNIVINAAAYTQVDKAETEQETANSINIAAPGLMGEECKKHGSLFIHFSTDYVFSGIGSSPQSEHTPTSPLNIYGVSKRKGEILVEKTNCHYIILRTSWVYAAGTSNFLTTMLRLAENKEELKIVNDQIGAPTSTQEIARAVVHLIHLYEENSQRWAREISGIYHFTCGGETSWLGFAEAIFEQAQNNRLNLKIKTLKGIPTEEHPTAAKRPLNSRLDCSLFTTKFGFEPKNWLECLTQVMKES